jgi:hypothetical protein
MQRVIGPLLAVLLFAGCSSAATPDGGTSLPPTAPSATPGETVAAPTLAPTTTAPTDAPETTAPTSPPTTNDPPAALPDAVWRTSALLDVRSGEMLTINELTAAGRLVVVEPMAIWCSNCRTQQNEARTALAGLGSEAIVYISLDVDPNETEPDLARYADEREYPWHFAVASREVARSLAEIFGDQVLSPPSTPKIVVALDGTAEVTFGLKRAADLEAQLSALLP